MGSCFVLHRATAYIAGVQACLLLAALLPAVVIAGQAPRPPDPAGTEFHFIVLGDSQFDDPSTFNRTIDQVRLLRPAFVIQVGYLINGYLDDVAAVRREWQRFRRQIEPLGPVPFYAVPGNHDLFNAQREVDPRLQRLFEEEWGALYYRFQYGNAAFIVLNSDSSQAPNGIDGEQLRWLVQTLERERTAHRFVFMHRPPRFMASGEALHELFVDHEVDYVVYGHHHHYHHEVRDGVRYVMTNNSGSTTVRHEELGGFNHLLQFSVRDDEVSMASIEVDAVRPAEFVEPRDNYEYFALSRQLSSEAVRTNPAGEHRYDIELPLANPTSRAVNVHVSCASADDRWWFEPRALPVVRLAPESSQTLELRAGYEASRFPESKPVCRIEVPYQASSGRWLRLEETVSLPIP